ncbi:TPA: hypothetical protein H2S71_004295 [Salmonella enterica]|nr:hypothetical protein [Salmonella enterica]HAK6690081.1 hypothetical protein [Salmonella enterica]
MLPSETMIWQPEFTDKTLSRKPGAVQSVPGTPALSAGDWPVMDTDPSTLRRVRRRSFSIIDNRNRKGYITRRFQCFPLAPLPENRKYDSLPDLVLHPEQETIKCKEKHYSQPL